MELLSAQWTFCPGAAPGRDALPAEEVPTGGGCAVPPLLQAQCAARLAPGRRLLAPAFLVGEVAVQSPLLPCSLLLFEAVHLNSNGQQKVEEGNYSKKPVT